MDPSILATLTPQDLRKVLPGFLATFIGDADVAAANKARIIELVESWSDEDMASVLHTLTTVGDELRLYPANPLGRQLSREWCRDIIPEHTVAGVENLVQAVQNGPTVVLCNHLSYIDSTATDAILAWNGHTEVADRLMAAAGPKVYQDMFRRVAAASLNTLPVPQSTNLAHTEQLSRRELARRAFASVEASNNALRDGYVLLLYPEGSRTRTGRLQPFLKGVHRYLAIEALHVVPTTILGTDLMMPVGLQQVRPAAVHLQFGTPIVIGENTRARDAVGVAHEAITGLLPTERRPDADVPALM